MITSELERGLINKRGLINIRSKVIAAVVLTTRVQRLSSNRIILFAGVAALLWFCGGAGSPALGQFPVIAIEGTERSFKNSKLYGVESVRKVWSGQYRQLQRKGAVHYMMTSDTPSRTDFTDKTLVTIDEDGFRGVLLFSNQISSTKPPVDDLEVSPPQVRNLGLAFHQGFDFLPEQDGRLHFLGPSESWLPDGDVSRPTVTGAWEDLNDKLSVRCEASSGENGSIWQMLGVRQRWDAGDEYNGKTLPTSSYDTVLIETTYDWDGDQLKQIIWQRSGTSSNREVPTFSSVTDIEDQHLGASLPDRWRQIDRNVPDGTPVTLMDTQQIEAEWRDGKIVRRFDSGAVAELAAVEMKPSSSWTLWVSIITGILLVVAFYLRRRADWRS